MAKFDDDKEILRLIAEGFVEGWNEAMVWTARFFYDFGQWLGKKLQAQIGALTAAMLIASVLWLHQGYWFASLISFLLSCVVQNLCYPDGTVERLQKTLKTQNEMLEGKDLLLTQQIQHNYTLRREIQELKAQLNPNPDNVVQMKGKADDES